MNESTSDQATFCSKCGTQHIIDSAFCRSCGTAVTALPQAASIQSSSSTHKESTLATDGLNNKLHITLICAASIAVLLLYTTEAFALIGMATGISFGLSLRLFFTYKKTNFIGTKKLDWMLLSIASTLAFILMLTEHYDFQAPLLIFVAVRALIMHFTMYSKKD